MSFLARLQACLEIRRLEDKYVRRTNRNTFTSGAKYVDGEYVYGSPSQLSVSSTGSSSKKPGFGDNGVGRGKRWSKFSW